MLLSSSALLLSMLIGSHASAGEIFKCVARDGTDLYQNFPCQYDSIGSMAVDAQSVRAVSGNSIPTAAKPPVTRVTASAKSGAGPLALRIGMTAEQVRAAWGEPGEIDQDEPRHGGRSEVWSYGPARTVRFDHKGLVIAVDQ